MGGVISRKSAHFRHGKRIAGQGAGLVRTQHIHRGRLVDGGQSGRQHILLRQLLGAEGGGKGEGRRQGHWHGRQHRYQDQGNEFRDRNSDPEAIGDEKGGNTAIDEGKVAYHPEDRLLLRAFDMGGAHQFGGASEFAARARRGDFGDGLAALHQRPGIGLVAWTGFDRQRLAGDHRLVEQHAPRDQADIGGDHGAETELDNIAGHQPGCQDIGPNAIPPHARP